MPAKFHDLDQGTIFTSGNDIYIKVEEGRNGDDSPFNAVCLIDGSLEYFMRSEVVVAETSAHIVFN